MRQERVRRRGRQGQHSAEGEGKSRKQLRKEKKQEKKDRRRQYFQQPKHHPINKAKNSKPQGVPKIASREQTQKQKKPASKLIQLKQETQKKKPAEKVRVKKKSGQTGEEKEDDKMIRMYEQKLGMGEGKENYNKIAKKYGFDDDIFDFLDGISKKVNNPNEQGDDLENDYDEEQMEEQISQEEQEEQQMGEQEEEGMQEDERDMDSQMEQMFDNLDEVPRDQDEDINQEMEQDQAEVVEEPQPKEQPVRYRSTFNKNLSESQIQIKRSMNGLFNKLSDGNILLTFRELMQIFESNPRSETTPIFAEIFTRFNLMTEKPLFHILATNIALLSALHYALGNRLLAPTLHSLTSKYLQLEGQSDDEQEVVELGYSKRVERLKNYATVIALLYNYGSLSGEFIESYVQQLAADLSKQHIQLLYLLVQKSGVRIRQNDPSTLRSVITTIKQAIDEYRKKQGGGQEEQQKVKFIELELNQIKFNKKSQNSTDQRMAFLDTFITKSVMKEIQKEREVFPLNYSQLCQADTSTTNWWSIENGAMLDVPYEEQQADEKVVEVAAEKKKLLQLAKSFQLVTEAKKNVFLCLMDSQDYIQATQRILQLKIRNMQDAASVLVQVCTLEPTFNPYYALVAGKIASLIPKFRLQLQYSVWDHLKLLHEYPLRRTNNLAKFTAKVVADPIANHSLSILKFYPDLSNISPQDHTFLKIFFNYFFKKVNQGYLSKLIDKLRQLNNRDVRLGIEEYLGDYEPEPGVRQKVKLCRRLLALDVEDPRLREAEDRE